MNHRPAPQDLPDPSVTLPEGWHCTHIYYRFDRARLSAMTSEQRVGGSEQLQQALDPDGEGASARLQTSIVSGHKADFGLMLMDPDPLVIDRVHQRLAATSLGSALESTYSFVSVTEISEYVPSLEQYGERLVREGEESGSDAYEAKMKAYEQRQPIMRKQRLTPDFPEWPVTCFYPMNKKRKVGENWFMLPFDERNSLMAEHARTGMTFAGKATQLITVGLGLDDWEWGVTLWGRTPAYLKEIVYRMRFDEASARYAEFGPFYTSYLCSPAEMLSHCGLPG
ncbi:MAG: hydrogen peroxide-dependent heme synthase [Planctomycetota bacterium]|nr:hydrogen peroxide-dependent heme synthase [Planctomycetota bacterium]MEE2990949.1 hydrogen peroxide-dependent heme synthase [Planctomycetota bacterium]